MVDLSQYHSLSHTGLNTPHLWLINFRSKSIPQWDGNTYDSTDAQLSRKDPCVVYKLQRLQRREVRQRVVARGNRRRLKQTLKLMVSTDRPYSILQFCFLICWEEQTRAPTISIPRDIRWTMTARDTHAIGIKSTTHLCCSHTGWLMEVLTYADRWRHWTSRNIHGPGNNIILYIFRYGKISSRWLVTGAHSNILTQPMRVVQHVTLTS